MNVGFFCVSCYQLATPGIAHSAREASIFKDTRFSDHAPLTIHYELGL
jgi:exodeoxyribonuclease-3